MTAAIAFKCRRKNADRIPEVAAAVMAVLRRPAAADAAPPPQIAAAPAALEPMVAEDPDARQYVFLVTMAAERVVRLVRKTPNDRLPALPGQQAPASAGAAPHPALPLRTCPACDEALPYSCNLVTGVMS